MKNVGYTWTKDEKDSEAQSSLASTLLVEAYAGLSPEDVAEAEDKCEEDRYGRFKRSFEALFDHARRTTFTPLDDDQISSDRPWRRAFDDHTIVDYSPKVDLRSDPRSRLYVDWSRPSICRVTDSSFNSENPAAALVEAC